MTSIIRKLSIFAVFAIGCIIFNQMLVSTKYSYYVRTIPRNGASRPLVTLGNITTTTTVKLNNHVRNFSENSFPNGESFTSSEAELLYCKRLIKNQTINKAPRVDLTTDKEVFQNAFNNCSTFKNNYKFRASNVSKEELDFPIAYSILIYENIQQFTRLLSAIYTTNNYYCVHLDAKSSLKTERATLAVTSCFPNVFMTSHRENVTYASYERLQADINCMKELLNLKNENNKWKYLINLCGQDFPVRTNFEIVRQLKILKGTNVVPGHDVMEDEVETLKRTKWKYEKRNVSVGDHFEIKMVRTNKSNGPLPHNPIMRKNSAYNIYTRDFLKWALLESKEAREILEWSKPTFSPDEHYWLLVNTLPDAPGGNKSPSWWSVVRYIQWLYNRPNAVCKGYNRHGVCVFGSGDLPRLVQRHELFINKLDNRFDSDVMTCLRHWLDDRVENRIPDYKIPSWL